MLQPADRRVLREALRPPQGYTVDRAIATTYSLDLVALLIAPLSFSLFDRIARREDPEADDKDALGATALLQAVRAHAERLTVYSQAGSIGSPGRYRQLLAYVEGSVVEVCAPTEGGIFHPKVWLQRFTSPSGPVRYRLLVNSRNLTFDRSWDTMLVLEGVLPERTNAFARNHPLGDFIERLPEFAVRKPLPKRIEADAKQLAAEVRRVAFEVPDGFDDELTFWPLGHDGKRRWPFDEKRIQRMLVVSPFVGAGMLDRLAQNGEGHVLISRADELAPLAAGALAAFSEVHVLNEAAEVEPEDGASPGKNRADEAATGLHAKLFVADAGASAHLWTGSANATSAAFEKNVEFLVQLTGKKSKFGVDAVLGEEGAGSSLRTLLLPYTPQTGGGTVDAVAARLDQRLRDLRIVVASLPWKAHVELDPDPGDDKERYRVELSAAGSFDPGPDAAIRCWPIAVAAEHGTPLTCSAVGSTATFSRLSFQALTSFFAFNVRAQEGDRSAEAVFVVNAPLEGAPEHRHTRILQAMLDDPAKVMRFLRMLLALDPLEGLEEILEGEEGDGGSSWSSRGSETPLLEALLRVFDRDPSRLGEFDRTIRELQSTPDSAALLPTGLDTIWLPLREAWQANGARGGQR
jgi:hypothetical protein